MTLAVHGQQAACLVQLDMVADGGKEVLNLALIRRRITNAVGGNHRQTERTCNADRSLVAPLFLALLVALQFDINVLVTEDAYELFDCFAAGCFTAARERRGQRPFVASGQADQARKRIRSRSSKVAAPSPFVASRILNCVMSWQRFW